jgi:hypothetical protein
MLSRPYVIGSLQVGENIDKLKRKKRAIIMVSSSASQSLRNFGNNTMSSDA